MQKIKQSALLFFLASSLMLSGCGMENNSAETISSEITAAVTEQEKQLNEEASLSAPETKTVEPLEKAVFDELLTSINIDGHNYSLPCGIKDLSPDHKINSGRYDADDKCTFYSVFSRDREIFSIWVKGDYSKEDVVNSDAVISSILISRDFMENVSFNIMGITQDSTNKDVIEILGIPNETYTDREYRYVYENNIYYFCFNDDKTIRMLAIITDIEENHNEN